MSTPELGTTVAEAVPVMTYDAPAALRSMRILVVDDQEVTVRVLVRTLERAGFREVYATTYATRAEALCQEIDADLVIADVHMPVIDGFQLVSALARSCPGVPVLVLTMDATPEIKYRAFAHGARDFLTKPFDDTEVFLRVANLLDLRRVHQGLAEANRTLEQRVSERTKELEVARVEVLERLALAAEYRDDDTHQHALRIGRTAALLGEQLGLAEREVLDLRRAATLHDIGKIAIPDAVLLKPGALEPHEFTIVKTHTQVGAQILSGSSSTLLRLAEEIALSHHERWDGRGYPNGLRGPDIPLSGRIVSVADVFDALAHARPYKAAWPLDEAVDEIIHQSGRQFDPEVVAAFRGLDHAALLQPVGS